METLTEKQIQKAKAFYSSHKHRIDVMIYESEYMHENSYPPTDAEDKNNPMIWKRNHWAWFLKTYVK